MRNVKDVEAALMSGPVAHLWKGGDWDGANGLLECGTKHVAEGPNKQWGFSIRHIKTKTFGRFRPCPGCFPEL